MRSYLRKERSLTNGIIVLVIISFIAFGCACDDLENLDEEEPEVKEELADNKMPSERYLKKLVGDTIMDFHESKTKDDYSYVYKNMSKDYQKRFPAEKIKERFNRTLTTRVNLAPIKDLEPYFRLKPKIERISSGRPKLHLYGSYATSTETDFSFEYVFEDGQWKLFNVMVLQQM